MSRLLLALATWLNGGLCPCLVCAERRVLEVRMRVARGALRRQLLRQAHRDSWRVGRGGTPAT